MGTATRPPAGTFRHAALFYAGEADFVARTVPFILDGVRRREPVLVVVPAPKLALLRWELGGDAEAVAFGDMAEVGRNPARIIPVWRRFIADRPPGLAARGVGEPAHAARTPEELVECRRHETLLNVAFGGSRDWDLVCPYDVSALPADVVAQAMGTHPEIDGDGPSGAYTEELADDPLPPPPAGAARLAYGPGPLDAVHAFVRANAMAAGLPPSRVNDLDIAVHELAINTIRHAGGRGLVLCWADDAHVWCEVRDDGVIRDPLAGRHDPSFEQESGRGLWIVNQLCDLSQVRSSEAGTTVRVRLALR